MSCYSESPNSLYLHTTSKGEARPQDSWFWLCLGLVSLGLWRMDHPCHHQAAGLRVDVLCPALSPGLKVVAERGS